MRYRILFVTLIGSSLLLVSQLQATTVELGLKDLIRLTIDNNPQLDVATQQYHQNKGQLIQAESGYLPRIALGASVGRLHVKDLQPVDEDNVLSGGVSGSQLLYDFGRTIGTIEASQYAGEAAKANLQQILHDVIFLIKDAYFSVLEQRSLVNVARQAVDNYEQHLYRAKKYFQAGVRTKIDITNGELELANAKLNLLRAKSNLKSSRVQLEQIVGLRPNRGDYMISSTHGAIEELADNVPPYAYSLDELLQTAMIERPGLEQLGQLYLSSEASLKSVRGDNWPRLSANGSYDTYETDIQSLNDQWQLTAQLNWEIFSGFETEGKIVEARARMLEFGAAKHELELAVIQDVTDSLLRVEENREAIDIADLAVTLAAKNLTLADGRYKAGLGDIIEFNDAQLNYTSAQSDLISTFYSYLTELARLERAAGINPDVPPDMVEKLLRK